MNFETSILFFFSALGAFNGILLSCYFIFFVKPSHRSHFYLGLLLLALSVRVGKSVFFYFSHSLADVYIQTGLLACWTIGPLLFYYVLEALEIPQRKWIKSTWVLSLFLLVGLFTVWVYPRSGFERLWVDVLINVIYSQWFIFLLLTGLIIFKEREKFLHTKKRLFTFWFLSIYLGNLIIFVAFNTAAYTSYIVGALSFTFAFYVLLLLLIFSKKKSELLLLDPKKYKNNKLLPPESALIAQNFESVIQDQKLFLDPNLSLVSIARQLNTSPPKLSQVLNEYLGVNFNDYINELRVTWSKKLISENSNYSIEAIGFESGFNAKSTFYAAFKKHEGTTPAKYRTLLSHSS